MDNFPRIPAPKVAYPDKDRLLRLAQPRPTTSRRVWAWSGTAAAVAGAFLALAIPTAEPVRVNLALSVPQVHLEAIEAPCAEPEHAVEPTAQSSLLKPKATVEVEAPKAKPQRATAITLPRVEVPAVRLAYDKPRPIIEAQPQEQQDEEEAPTLFDLLLEPFRTERPKSEKLIASITIDNPFKKQYDDERF